MTPLEQALLSLDGLSVGDALGAAYGEGDTLPAMALKIAKRELLSGQWRWTDDTHMAMSIVEILAEFGEIDAHALAERFGERFIDDPYRGYAGGARRLLTMIANGYDWQELAPQLFEGGSYGNGGAMRAAPIGGYFAGEPSRVAQEAKQSAIVTHAHPEGQAGAIGVTVAAAIAAGDDTPQGNDFLAAVAEYMPDSEVKDGIQAAMQIGAEDFEEAVKRLGTGWQVSAQDTVPFCLWCAAHHLDSYEDALWKTVAAAGDRDTTCAIVGGIVALSTGEVPKEWLRRREGLPADFAP
jgi:ADP-ribosylglycohydrolase